MILASDTNISNVLSIFSSCGLKAAFLVPTETAMKKSIIDATDTAREYLLKTGTHDYKNQKLGTDYKVLKETFFVGEKELTKTVTSMYRPITKKGDPRIWFYQLNSYAVAYNLLAIVANEVSVYVINCSDQKILESLNNGSSPLFNALQIANDGLTPEAWELLRLPKNIGKSGWVTTLRKGDTGVGYTLETLLGISVNSSKAPDFKGVEIKSSRNGSSNQTLFSKTPDWRKSRLKSSLQILEERGRFSTEENRK